MSENRFNIICGDSKSVLAGMDDCSIDVVITDPPYGINFNYNKYNDTRENLKKTIDWFIPEAMRVSKSRVCVLCGPTQIGLYPQPDWVGCISWNTTGSFGKYGYNQWTPILLYGKDKRGFGSVDGCLKSDTIRISGGGGVGFMRNKSEKKHTCPKPITIMNAVVSRFSAPGDVVLDPFCGSGQTGISAIRLGREFVGIDIDNYYCGISSSRIAAEVAMPIFDSVENV